MTPIAWIGRVSRRRSNACDRPRLRLSPPRMKMMHRAVARADLNPIRGGERGRDVGLGALRCRAEVEASGETRCDGG